MAGREEGSISSDLENILLNSPGVSKHSNNSEMMESNLMDTGFILLSTETVYNELPNRLKNYRTQANEGKKIYSTICLLVEGVCLRGGGGICEGD